MQSQTEVISMAQAYLDCNIKFEQQQQQQQQQQQPSLYEFMKKKLKQRNIVLKGDLAKVVGENTEGFNNSDMQNSEFNCIMFLKYKKQGEYNKLFLSDHCNHIIRSIGNLTVTIDGNGNEKWNGELQVEVGQADYRGYSDGDRNTCKLRYPSGFDWDTNENLYICNVTSICKLDSKTNQVSLLAGHASDKGYKDGICQEARFDFLRGVLCHQRGDQFPPALYACDFWNHCIRMIDITSGKTTTFTGKGKEEGDVDGVLLSARFCAPSDISVDNEYHNTLFICDNINNKIKMIDMKKGMVTTLVGDQNDRSILFFPRQMQIVDSFIYVTCDGFGDGIVRVDKHSKQMTKIKFNDGKSVKFEICGIAYHELNQCFFISDSYVIYRLQ